MPANPDVDLEVRLIGTLEHVGQAVALLTGTFGTVSVRRGPHGSRKHASDVLVYLDVRLPAPPAPPGAPASPSPAGDARPAGVGETPPAAWPPPRPAMPLETPEGEGASDEL